MHPDRRRFRSLALGYAWLIASLKALGGSFHSLISKLGWLTYHGAIVGGAISTGLAYFYYSFTQLDLPMVAKSNRHRTKRAVFVIMYLALVVGAMTVRIRLIHSHPPNIKQADMIPMVLAGLKSVAEGVSPYFPRVLEDGRSQPGYYLPGLWLIYTPFYLLGLDIRYANLLPPVTLYLLLLVAFLRRKRFAYSFKASALGLLVLVGVHGFSKLMIAHTDAGHTAAFGFLYLLFIWGVFARRPWLVRGVLPLLLISREIAVFLVFPYLFYLLLRNRKELWKTLAVAIPVVLLLTVPFIVVSGKEFFAQMLEYRRTNEAPVEAMLAYYGWRGLLKKWGLQFLAPFLQLSGTVWALISLWRRPKLLPMDAVALGGVAFLTFILFVSTTWGYLFVEPIALAYMLIEVAGHERKTLE